MSTAARRVRGAHPRDASERDERLARAGFLFFVITLVVALLAFIVLPFVG